MIKNNILKVIYKNPLLFKENKMAQRSFFGKLIKWIFIGFNLLMLFWLISGMMGASEVVSSASSDAEQAGAAIGTGIGMFLIFTVWAIGDIILGIFVLLTRPKN